VFIDIFKINYLVSVSNVIGSTIFNLVIYFCSKNAAIIGGIKETVAIPIINSTSEPVPQIGPAIAGGKVYRLAV
jgi:hypothetical protein